MTRPKPRYQSGDRIGGRYQVHKALQGGMGEVYLCLDLEQNYPYALKTFQQRYQSMALRQAFEQEVATWVALEKHPNIVRCFYMDILDNQPFMVLEWIAGEEGKGADLRGWLRHDPLDLKTALEITIDVVRGLTHAQEKQPGLVHRDLKPENILVAQGGLAKITDFGLAQIVQSAGLEIEGEADGRQSMVGKGGIAGTPAYMAPEQWRGEPLDERTDIYAVGCILYEMLAGKWPFQVDFMPTTPEQLQNWLRAMQNKHENQPLPDLPSRLSVAGSELVAGCLAKESIKRFANMHELLQQLSCIYQQQYKTSPRIRSEIKNFTAIDYANRGATYAILKQVNRALADLNQAIYLAPDLAIAYNNRGSTYHDVLHQFGDALTDFNQAVQLDPDYSEAYFNRGNAYRSLQKYEDALVDYNRAIQIDPTNVKAYINRGNTYAYLKQYDEALADHDKAVRLSPTATNYNNRANTFSAMGKYKKALTDHCRAIQIDPTFTKVYLDRANSHCKLRRYEDALADLDYAIQLEPTNADIYSERGNIHHSLKRYHAALSDYSEAIRLDPGNAKFYYNRGNTYAVLERYEDALVDHNQSIQLNLDFAMAYTNRGNDYHHLQNYNKALADHNRAIQLNPNDAVTRSSRANTYAVMRRYEEAIKDYSRAIELDPQYATAYFNLGGLYANIGQLHKSLSYFEQAAQLGHPLANQAISQVRHALGESTFASGANPTQVAFEAFQQATSLAEMRQAVARYPFMMKVEFIDAIEQVIAQQSPVQHRPHFEQRLAWLKQIARKQNS